MLRSSMIALCATAAMALLAPQEALARGGIRGGGGYHAGGFYGSNFRAAAISGAYRAPAVGGYRVAAVRSAAGYYPGYRPLRGYRLAAATVAGAGLAYGGYPYGGYPAGYGYYDDSYYGNGYYTNDYSNSGYYPSYDDVGNYAYDGGGYYGGNCYVIQRHVPMPYGWVLSPVRVCN